MAATVHPAFSISMDVVGSTDIKRSMLRFASAHGLEVASLYAQFGDAMLRSKIRFVECLMTAGLELDRIFLVKSIGDELWFTYDLEGLSSTAVSESAAKVVNGTLDFLYKTPEEVVAMFPAPVDDPIDDQEWSYVPDVIERFPLKWKVVADVIDGAVDVSSMDDMRLSRFLVRFTKSGKAKGTAQLGDSELLRWRNRLGMGASASMGNGKGVQVNRTDLLGWKVDRFFRIAKQSAEGWLLSGHEFIDHLKPISGDAPGNVFVPGSTSNLIAYSRLLQEADLKGIGDYKVTLLRNLYPAVQAPNAPWAAGLA